MNKAIRSSTMIALLMVLVLLINLTVVQGFREETYAQNPLNKRQFYEMKSTPRGQISTGGVVLAKSSKAADDFYYRSYPSTNPQAYAPVSGYLSDIYGAAGLEQGFNEVLNGTDPSMLVSNTWDTLTGKEHDGASLKLTLLPEAQEVAYQQLVNNNYEGAVVALKPSTGEVLAMAQTPSFDPNTVVDNDSAEQAWERLTSDPASPLLNHATQETLPPGSIFKIITSTAGLRNGYEPGSQLTGEAKITLPNSTSTLENYGGRPCAGGGEVSLTTAFSLSCNTAFVQMGVDVGEDALYDAAKSFGIGDTYDLGLPETPSSVGDLSDPARRGVSSIGQADVAMTVLDAAVMAATVANNGKRMKPYVVDEVLRPDLSTLSSHKPQQAKDGLDEDVAAKLQELMRQSERNTSGGRGDIASKTGTAEHGEDSRSSFPHTWYVAFAPDKDADVAVAVVVKNGGNQGAGATGGSVSAPIGRAVIDAVLRTQA
ncbi:MULTISPECIES: penicillin-binding transpeptidase domain-containing protein [Corynebacterium]|uniref:penicillin-binding transpeptidase domain-containing protein n=1 Tax=Corynebacterium TaxID=1716 RepID=UPI00124DEAE5|nr:MULTISPECIES: penicillin-binding transpeptidase domain-containing protein [Corynebacterium]